MVKAKLATMKKMFQKTKRRIAAGAAGVFTVGVRVERKRSKEWEQQKSRNCIIAIKQKKYRSNWL